MTDRCPKCASTDIAELMGGGNFCLDCEFGWGLDRKNKHVLNRERSFIRRALADVHTWFWFRG